MEDSVKTDETVTERLNQTLYQAELAASSKNGEIKPEIAITELIEATSLLAWLQQSPSSVMKRNQARRMFFDNDGNFDSEGFINFIDLVKESGILRRN